MSVSPAQTIVTSALRAVRRTLRNPALGIGILTLTLAACGSSEEPFSNDDTGLIDAGSDAAADASEDTSTDTDVGLCDGPNPAGCSADADCPTDAYCQAGNDECFSSSCSCDPDSGWTCTSDCGGGICVPISGECANDSQCGFGAEWCVDGSCEECDNGAMLCDIACEEGFGLPDPRNGCVPCECVPDDGCEGPNPAGCSDEGCPSGQACVPFDADECIPSSCFCDEGGGWGCTDDCGGGSLCMPVDIGECDTDDDCPIGDLCVGSGCASVDCTEQYDPVCGVDHNTYGNACEANAAHVEVAYAGECERETECGSDADCAPGQGCFEGFCEFIGCPEIWAPVCGVDGNTYGNECEANAARVAIAYEGECEPTSGVDCGTAGTCARDELCSVGYPGVPDVPPTYQCSALPEACIEDRTCECVMPDRDPDTAMDCSDGPNGVTISSYYP